MQHGSSINSNPSSNRSAAACFAASRSGVADAQARSRLVGLTIARWSFCQNPRLNKQFGSRSANGKVKSVLLQPLFAPVFIELARDLLELPTKGMFFQQSLRPIFLKSAGSEGKRTEVPLKLPETFSSNMEEGASFKVEIGRGVRIELFRPFEAIIPHFQIDIKNRHFEI